MKCETTRRRESGNVVFYVLLGVALVGIVTAALRSGGQGGANIDKEDAIIKASQVKQQAQEIERGIAYIMQKGVSENDIRFAHADAPSSYGNPALSPEFQMFGQAGGGAEYADPPDNIFQDPNGAGTWPDPHEIRWEFFGHTAMPGVGSSRADLVAVLPYVTKNLCDQVNSMNGQTATPRETAGGCIFDPDLRFGALNGYTDTSPNLLDETAASFSNKPALQACVDCNPGGTAQYHVYHVLLAR